MDRRTFLKSGAGASALAATGGLATPAISQRVAARTLRFVPQADLSNFDPIWTTTYIARNAGVLAWDMLYGVDQSPAPEDVPPSPIKQIAQACNRCPATVERISESSLIGVV
jgi:peptide/nickel transport system substrate-binding protein